MKLITRSTHCFSTWQLTSNHAAQECQLLDHRPDWPVTVNPCHGSEIGPYSIVSIGPVSDLWSSPCSGRPKWAGCCQPVTIWSNLRMVWIGPLPLSLKEAQFHAWFGPLKSDEILALQSPLLVHHHHLLIDLYYYIKL